jgi:ferredoxin
MIEVPEEISTRCVQDFLKSHGADLVGIASIDRFPSDGSNQDPRIHFRRVQSVVAFARRVAFSSATPYPSVASLQFGDFTLEGQLNELAYETSLWLENGGEMTMPMPAGRDVVSFEILQRPPEEPKIRLRGSFDLRYAAVVAGIGQIGANGLVINEKFGSRIRLCAVLTTAVLEPTRPFEFGGKLPDFCDECGYRCVKACPAAALSEHGKVDHYRCLAIKPELVDPEEVLSGLQHELRGTPVVLAAKQLSYTTSPPHTCSTCTTQCPMDVGRALSKTPFPREGWVEADFSQAATYPVRKQNV